MHVERELSRLDCQGKQPSAADALTVEDTGKGHGRRNPVAVDTESSEGGDNGAECVEDLALEVSGEGVVEKEGVIHKFVADVLESGLELASLRYYAQSLSKLGVVVHFHHGTTTAHSLPSPSSAQRPQHSR